MSGHDFSQLGYVIKELRQTLGMSQLDLCKGICAQSQLSKIEVGESLPNATTLYLLAQRLGVDVNTLFEMTSNSRMDYVFTFISEVRRLIRKKDYQSVLSLIEGEEHNPVFLKNKFNFQFLLWHKGICLFHLEKKAPEALELLNKALSLTNYTNNFFTTRELEILNSIGVIHFENEQYSKAADVYDLIINSLRRIPVHPFKIKIRVYYNYAKALTRQNRFLDSNHICIEDIQLCLKEETLYLLGELYYHTGYNYLKMEKKKEAIQHLETSKTIFTLTKNETYYNHVNALMDTYGIDQTKN